MAYPKVITTTSSCLRIANFANTKPYHFCGKHFFQMALCVAVQIFFIFNIATACATDTQQVRLFHSATTEPEHALDAILLADSDNSFFLESVYQRPDPINPQDKRALQMLSHQLIKTLHDEEQKHVMQYCGGHYLKGELCGFDYSPVLCGQDSSEQGYLFRTVLQTKVAAELQSIWAEDPVDASRTAKYYLKREDNRWKLDGIDCGQKDKKFNVNK